MLDYCLLTDEELAIDQDQWADFFPDPFPEWNTAMPE